MIADLPASPYALRLYHLELAPGFRSLAARVAEPVRGLQGEGGVQDVNLALFLAPPGAVTPAHPDRHHNLLLQVSGTKDVWIEDLSGDPVARHRRGVSYFHHPGAGVPELPPARLVRLGPGDGVYIPPTSYHWTRVTGDEGSVALSVGFATTRTVGEERLSQIDVSLRRLGWRRSRPATSQRRLSRAKGAFVNAIDGARGRAPRIPR
jgi:mannose-6-phosphate isomerase-like protein (cupin superfamily)